MRYATMAVLAAMAAGAATMATPAVAYDYPYCVQGGGYGVPGDCSYRTYAQCQASASGRKAFCNVNPRAAFNQQQQPRRERTYRNY